MARAGAHPSGTNTPRRASPNQFQASYRLWLRGRRRPVRDRRGRGANDEPQVGNPSGGAWSTVGDLPRFAQALTGHRLLSPAPTDTILAGKVDSNRPGPGEHRYADGFSDQKINGVRIVGHNGGSLGYEAQLDLYPDRGDVVVILTNQDQVRTPAIQPSHAILTRQP